MLVDFHIREGLEELQRLKDLFLVSQEVRGRTRKAQLSTLAAHQILSQLQPEDSKFPYAIKGNTQWGCTGFGMCEISHLRDSTSVCVRAAFLHVRFLKSMSYSIPRRLS